MSEEKSFKPSKKKLEKARRDGRVLCSKFLSQVVVITVTLGSASILIPQTWVASKMLLKWSLTDQTCDIRTALIAACWIVVRITGIVLGTGGLAALAVSAAQVGFHVEAGVLSARVERLNPFIGLKKIMSSAMQEGVQLFLRGCVIIALIWYGLRGLLNYASVAAFTSASITIEASIAGLFIALGPLLTGLWVLGLIDYGLKRRKYYRDLSMTREEVRDERKNEEGDPLVASTRRSMHEALAMQDLVKRVRRAKVILVEKNLS